MNWTALVAELVVIGVQVLVWLCLGVVYVYGLPLGEVLPSLEGVKELPNSIAVLGATLVFVLAYTLGVLFDKVMDVLVEKVAKRRLVAIWEGVFEKSRRKSVLSEKMSRIGSSFYRAEDDLYGEKGQETRVYRRRGRIRIVRASLANVLLITITLALHLRQVEVILIGVAIFAVALFVFLSVHKEYIRAMARHARHLDQRDFGVLSQYVHALRWIVELNNAGQRAAARKHDRELRERLSSERAAAIEKVYALVVDEYLDAGMYEMARLWMEELCLIDARLRPNSVATAWDLCRLADCYLRCAEKQGTAVCANRAKDAIGSATETYGKSSVKDVHLEQKLKGLRELAEERECGAEGLAGQSGPPAPG